jgi:transposase
MPRMVSFLKDIKRYHTVLGDMLLYPLTPFTSSHTSVIFRHLDFCAVQILCTVCSTYIAIDRWDAHRSAHGRERASQPTTSTFNISIDTTSFDSFFHHENVQGERLSLIQRSTIVALHSLNIRNDVIAHLTHCDPHTIQHWITRYEDGDSLEDEPRSGRPRVTSEVTDTSIVATATENPITTPRILRSELGVQASARTVRRRLDEAGLFGRVARIEYPFTEENITARLQFAREHESWTDDQWARVLFGDETYICLGVNGQIWVQRPQDAAYLSEYMVQGQKGFTQKIGIWACFSSQGVGELRMFEDNMDTRLYTDTMQQLMKPCALRFWPSGAWFYLQDNAFYHTSHRSLEWFHNNGVSLVELPRHSPDLNPIENLWADLNRRLESHHIQTIEELRDIIPLEWKKTTALTCSNLVDSMPDRMRAVVTAEGFKTRY